VAKPSSHGRFSARTRAGNIERFQREKFDIAVVGGGITGAGIVRDAVLRGLSVALLEKGDFGSGTSSKSSRMIHGGLRYRQLHVSLVRESSRSAACC
jgi:glycerol-3-phosphate dehydrogenase